MRHALQTLLPVGVALAAWAAPVCAKPFSIWGAMEVQTAPPLPPERGAGDETVTPEQSRHEIAFASAMPAGSILIKTAQRKLYYIEDGGRAVEYTVAVGRQGFTWHGSNVITRKAEWPDWRPPREMIAREAANGHIIPDLVKGGPGNPLGARALYIGDTDYRIHGTDKPWSIGHASSSGCIRMLNADVIELYGKVGIGARVIVE